MQDRGNLYILKNALMPHAYKIGLTREEVSTRVLSLNSTSLPTPFVAVWSLRSDHILLLEKHVHRKLRSCRVNPKREFFMFPDDATAVAAVGQIVESFAPRPYTNKEQKALRTALDLSPAKLAKAHGLKSLAQVSEITGASTRTLANWCQHKPKLFKVVLVGSAAICVTEHNDE